MLEKFDFGDFYRFCVSLGLGLMLASFVIPWLLVKDQGLVRIPEANESGPPRPSRKESLPLDVAHAEANRQHYVRVAYTATPYLMISLGAFSLVFFCYGFANWRTRQLRRDSKENAEIDQVLKSLKPATEGELTIKREADEEIASADIIPPVAVGAEIASQSAPGDYALIENQVLAALRRGLHETFETYRDRKLGSLVIDGLLVPRVPLAADIIVEVKLIKRAFKLGWLFEVASRVASMCDLYNEKFRRRARGLLIVVATADSIRRFEQMHLRAGANYLLKAFPQVDVRIISEDLISESMVFGDAFIEQRAGVYVMTSLQKDAAPLEI